MTETTDSGIAPRARLKLIRAWYLLGALMLLIVGALSLMPAPDVGVGDKLSHVITYFLLAGWFGLLAANRVVLIWTVAGLMAYGILLELLQGMTVYRFAEGADILANGCGIMIGITLYFTPLTRVLEFVDGRLALLFRQR